MGDAGYQGARAPGEHESRDALLGPPPQRAWRNLDRAVRLAMAPILHLDGQLARPRLPRVLPAQAGTSSPALEGVHDHTVQERRVRYLLSSRWRADLFRVPRKQK